MENIIDLIALNQNYLSIFFIVFLCASWVTTVIFNRAQIRREIEKEERIKQDLRQRESNVRQLFTEMEENRREMMKDLEKITIASKEVMESIENNPDYQSLFKENTVDKKNIPVKEDTANQVENNE